MYARIPFAHPVRSPALCCALLLIMLTHGAARAEGQIMPPNLRAYAGIDTTTARENAVHQRELAEELEAKARGLEEQARVLASNAGIQEARGTISREIARQQELVASAVTQVSQNRGGIQVLQDQIRGLASDSAQLEGTVFDLRQLLERHGPANEQEDEDEVAGDAFERVNLASELEAHTQQLRDVSRRLATRRSDVATLEGENRRLEAEIGRRNEEIESRRGVLALLNADQVGQAVQEMQRSAADRRAEAARARQSASELEESARTQTSAVRRGLSLRPVRSPDDAAFFYNEPRQLSPGRSANLTIGRDGNGSATAELARIFAGPARLLVSGIVAKGDSQGPADESGDALPPGDPSDVRRFFAGGGNLVFSAATPLVSYVDRNFTAVVQPLAKWGMDLPGGGFDDVEVSTTNMNLDGGADVYFSWGVDREDRVRAFGFMRIATAGGTDRFYHGLGVPHERFRYRQMQIGGEVRNFGRLLFTRSYGPGPLEDPWRITLQMTP